MTAAQPNISPTTSMSSPFGFLDLPRELRDFIYHHYAYEKEGYHYHTESSRLRAPGNQRIDLAFMYTCSTVAREMHHLALGTNVLHFFTSESPSYTERNKAARFDWALQRIDDGRLDAFHDMYEEPGLHHYRTTNADAQVALRYPQFKPLLDLPLVDEREPGQYFKQAAIGCWIGLGGKGSTWGQADSVFRDFLSYIFETWSRSGGDHLEARARSYDERLASEPDPSGQDKRGEWCEKALFLRSPFIHSGPESWTIPSEDRLAQIETILGPSSKDPRGWAREDLELDAAGGPSPPLRVGDEPWDRVRWRFSAAAAAIEFFKSVSQDTCLGIHKIVLHEDRPSVAHPECHARGLIPFCRQNPQLHIERRVNIWRVLFVRENFGSERSRNFIHERTERLDMMSQDEAAKWDDHDRVAALSLPVVFSRWITEAEALSANGMPARSFSLVFDGDPAPDQASAIFEMVKEDAARQIDQARWYAKQSPSPDFCTVRAYGFYVSDVFPQAIADIVGGASFISCNFPTGELHDPDFYPDLCSMVHRRFYASWSRTWAFRCAHNPIRLSPPLPALLADIALEDLIPKEQRPGQGNGEQTS
ncbi:MAG: hypothetical protein Q9169_006384 [Polycauliona sp. 2 TL-2023]